MTEQDKKTLVNIMMDYSKDKGFPFYEKVLKQNAINEMILSQVSKEDYYNNLLKDYVESEIENHSKTKMGKSFKEKYLENKELFLDFCKLNVNKKFDNKFNELGEKIQSSLQEIENDLFKSIDNSQYKSFAGGIDNKYKSFIKKIFPYYENIGIKVRNINNI